MRDGGQLAAFLWRQSSLVLARLLGWAVGRPVSAVSVYAAGSVASGRVAAGVSDLDLVIVGPAGTADRLRERWQRLRGSLGPLLRRGVDLAATDEADLADATRTPPQLYGLKDGRPAYLHAGARGGVIQRERPGIGQPMSSWLLLSGPERRRVAPAPDADQRRLAVWLELQRWWAEGFMLSAMPGLRYARRLADKIALEPWRAASWLQTGGGRPSDEAASRLASRHGFATAGVSDPREVLAALTAATRLVAARFEEEARGAGYEDVRLVGGCEGDVCLADWRGVAIPRTPDRALAVGAGDPTVPATLGAAARNAGEGLEMLLRSAEAPALLVLPTLNAEREAPLRAIHSAITAPALAAQLDGDAVATFPRLRGFSIGDLARRALAEHRGWLHEPGPPRRTFLRLEPMPDSALFAARLLGSMRAATLARSVVEGAPTLPLRGSDALSDPGLPQTSEVALAAWEGWRSGQRVPAIRPLRSLAAALLPLLDDLDAELWR